MYPIYYNKESSMKEDVNEEDSIKTKIGNSHKGCAKQSLQIREVAR
jgi:hypothetical protein